MKIRGTGRALPSLVVTNNTLSQFLDTSDEWITTRTGIKERRILSNETILDLAVEAGKNALENAQIGPKDLDFIIVSNVANNFVTPSLSSIVQGQLGATCPCIDINVACTGFVYAIDMVDAYFRTGRYQKILIIAAEEPSKFVDWRARDASILFGDGAGAVVVTNEAPENLIAIHLNTTCATEPLFYERAMEPNPFNEIPQPSHPLIMNGREVYKLAVSSSIADIKKVFEKTTYTPHDVSLYLLHQANTRILETIRDFLEEPIEKFPRNIHKYGNTSSASIPILLDEINREGRIKENDLLMLSAFGGGFCTGAALIRW
ncbi:MAG TPA: beta-ketoacyl-ACP synthase III [Bacteroidales bacterium]|nr:beta-ketoacyl-ACP synthase III [Bacteroidales bacterium]